MIDFSLAVNQPKHLQVGGMTARQSHITIFLKFQAQFTG
jgi:hypothetical protein